MPTIAIIFFILGFGATVLYYNSKIKHDKFMNSKELEQITHEKSCKIQELEARLDETRKQIIENTVVAIMLNDEQYKDYSIPLVVDMVLAHSPTQNYNLYNIEHCTYENIKDTLIYTIKMHDSIRLLRCLMDERQLSYDDDADLMWFFDEDLPLKELTEDYANEVIDNWLKEM